MPDPEKTLFVICPIGADDSPERKASDELLEYVIEPVAGQKYKIERADRIVKTGSITSQIFDLLLSADLVIADMTGHNANVFYELAVRHAIGKPVIHMIATGGAGIPFDVADQRAIYYTLSLTGAREARDLLARMLLEIEGDQEEPLSPISAAVQRKVLSTPVPSSGKRDAEMMAMLSDIRRDIRGLADNSLPGSAIKVRDTLTATRLLLPCLQWLQDEILPIASIELEFAHDTLTQLQAVMHQLAKLLDQLATVNLFGDLEDEEFRKTASALKRLARSAHINLSSKQDNGEA